MPELPEVETLCRELRPLIIGQQVVEVVVRCESLRWPVPVADLQQGLVGGTIQQVSRRGKYLLIQVEQGVLIVHLGMSGRLSFYTTAPVLAKHDHVVIRFASGAVLYYSDPRRFGSLSWTRDLPARHPLLADLGPEPLEADFSGHYLWQQAENRRTSIKSLLMDSHVVVGIGNIYAAEALHQAAVHPARPAGSLSEARCEALVAAIRVILQRAIEQGGTTIKDYRRAEGSGGYFQQVLQVYGHKGKPCPRCGTILVDLRLGGRASCCCPACQR